jgi:CheY-like chemotaxis protein
MMDNCKREIDPEHMSGKRLLKVGIDPAPRILLVDNDKDHLELFTMILENEGYSVDAYADPDTALSKFRPNYYDLALLDYLMPHLNGLELYRELGR